MRGTEKHGRHIYGPRINPYAYNRDSTSANGSPRRHPREDYWQTAKLPSDTFLWAATRSIAASLALKIMGRDKDALFVGQWAPTFLIFGLYNKLVKQLGSDRTENQL